MAINHIKPRSKAKTALIIHGCIAFGVLKSVARHPPHTEIPSYAKYDYLTLNLQEKLAMQ
jgi:hypothetical protein